VIKWLIRQWDKRDTGVFRTLYCHGNWRVVYPDGSKTSWLQYHFAKGLSEINGGYVMHRNQQEQSYD